MKRAKYFTATWCGPCQAFKPLMEGLRAEGHDIEIIDIDKNQDLAKSLNIQSVPTTIIEFVDSKDEASEVQRIVGARTKQQMYDLLNG